MCPVPVSDFISPKGVGNFATHIDTYGQGGLMTVNSLVDRDAIIQPRRKLGMIVYVSANQTYYTLKTALTNASWEVAGLGASFGGDLSSTPINQTVVGIQNIPVLVGPIQDGYGLLYSQLQGAYIPQPVSITTNTLQSGWNTVYEINYASLPSQGSSPTMVIDSHTYTLDNVGAATSIGLVNGSGLVIQNSGTSCDYANLTRTAPIFSVNVKELFPEFDITSHQVRISVYTTQSNILDNQYSGVGFEYTTTPTNQYMTMSKGRIAGFNLLTNRFRFDSTYTEHFDSLSLFTNNTLQSTFVSNSEFETRSGVYGVDFADQDTYTLSRRARPVNDFRPSISNDNDLRICLFSASQSNSNFTTTFHSLKLEVYLSGSGSGQVVEASSTLKGILRLNRDLGGTATDPLVVGFQGRNVSSALPNNGDTWTYNDVLQQWEPKPGLSLTTVVVSVSYTISNGQKVNLIDTQAAAGPIIILMPMVANDGDLYYVKDIGGAAQTKTITINGNGKNIDNSITFIIDINYMSIGLVFGNNKWNII